MTDAAESLRRERGVIIGLLGPKPEGVDVPEWIARRVLELLDRNRSLEAADDAWRPVHRVILRWQAGGYPEREAFLRELDDAAKRFAG